LRTACNLH